ncbi:hypothetical protein BS78_09G040500 [Paspalum vaginatum]|nr:hypothetical protein BS78_09G040500 [Paspalum vaginatum]
MQLHMQERKKLIMKSDLPIGFDRNSTYIWLLPNLFCMDTGALSDCLVATCRK